MTSRIAGLSSLAPATAKRPAEVGITTPDQFARTGAVAAFRQVEFRFGRDVTLTALYGLEAAVRNVDWRSIDPAIRHA